MGISALSTAAPAVNRNLRVVADTAERDALGAALGVLGTGVHAYQLSDFQTYVWHGNQWIRLAKGQYGSGTPVEVDTAAGSLGVSDDIARRDHRHKLADSGWIVPTLLNGWINYDANAYSPARYRKIGGIVIITGLVKGGPIGGTGGEIFVLPVGYRPTKNLHLSTPTNAAHGILEIRAAVGTPGSVYANTGSNVWFSLECSFAAEV